MIAPVARRLGAYELIEQIGEGGESTVWRAICRTRTDSGVEAGEEVAVKILRNQADGFEIRAFRNQTRTLPKLRHRNIVLYRDSFAVTGDDGLGETSYGLVTELLKGRTLRDVIAQETSGIPWERARSILSQMLEALSYLAEWGEGIFHRDLKPSNFFLTDDGVLKLIDFGIARNADTQETRTNSNAGLRGSFDYMAPELASARQESSGDERSEIFSFGVCACQILTGTLPFPPLPNRSPVAFFERWSSGTPMIPDLRHSALRIFRNGIRFLNRCLEPGPAARFQSFAEVAREFEQVEPRRLRKGDDVYEFQRYLGKGGFGQVFLAERSRDGLKVAIKILFESLPTRRFEREADLLRRLIHPRLVRYIDFLSERVGGESDRLCLVLEFLEGMPEASLQGRIRASSPLGLPLEETLRHFQGYLECLEFLHGQKVYHRDIKPANLYAPHGRPEDARVFDLGIAREEDQTHTQGFVPGTLNYMPPEFAQSGSHRGSAPSDLYALGASLHQALTGCLPFRALPHGEKEALEEYLSRALKPPAQYDALLTLDHPIYSGHQALSDLVRKALRHRPDRRFQSAAEMRRQIEAILTQLHPISSPDDGDATTIGYASSGSESVTLRRGSIIGNERFRLIRQIAGRESNGRVWLASDEERSEAGAPVEVVVRLVPEILRVLPEGSPAPHALAVRAAGLTHPNIIPVQVLHEPQNELPFLVMDWIEGTDLHEWVAGQPGGRFTGAEIQPLLNQIWAALEHAHQQGIPHQALDLDKIRITPDRRVKITGFGLGRRWWEVPPDEPEIPGPFRYASPEQRQGAEGSAADDIYALGVILYQLVTGQLPFRPEQLRSNALPPLPPPIEEVLGTLPAVRSPLKAAAAATILRCLAPDPGQRPPSIQAFRLWWQTGPPDPKPQPPPPQPPKPPLPWLRLILGTLLIAGSFAVLFRDKSEDALSKGSDVPVPAPVGPFFENDVTDRRQLAIALKNASNPSLALILSGLAPQTREGLLRWTEEDLPPTNLCRALLNDFNALVRTSSWDRYTFGSVSIRPDTEAALTHKATPEGQQRLNVLLLKDLFPTELSQDGRPPILNGSLPRGETNTRLATLSLHFINTGRLPVSLEIYTNELGLTGLPPVAPWLRKVDIQDARLEIPNLPPGVHRLDAGTTPKRMAQTWTRQWISVSGTEHASVQLDFLPLPFEVHLTDPAAVELKDGWGNILATIGTHQFEKSTGQLYDSRSSFGRALSVLPGDFRLVLSDQTGTDRPFEPINVLKHLVRPPRGSPIIFQTELTPARFPRLDARWTNSLGTSLLPVSGSRAFLAARTETTIAEFDVFARTTGFRSSHMLEISASGVGLGTHLWRDFPSRAATNHPVVGISWDEAVAFCDWLTTEERRQGRLATNQFYDLPTSDQWNRMVGPALYPWGENFPPDQFQGNYAGPEVQDHARSSGWPEAWRGFVLDYDDEQENPWPRTTPVGRYQAAPDKFADLGGNAAEWCRDVFGPEMYQADEWTNPSRRLRDEGASGRFKVVRGGAWRDHDLDLLRSRTCWAEPPDIRTDWLGFRIILEERP